MGKEDGRVLLPADVTPSKYAIELDVDLDQHRFTGKQAVTCTVHHATTSITLHSKELYITHASWHAGDKGEVECVEMRFNLKLTTVELVFSEELAVGDGELRIDFEGCLNNQMAGFYRSSYTRANGEKGTMASTQFEPIDARRCFPCWDEPHRKAVFEMCLVVPSDRLAFSNMPESRVEHISSTRKRVQFAPSPIMSSYLVAMCVGEFDFVQASTKHGVAVRVFTPPGKSQQGLFSLKVACDSLDFYDDYFGVNYPLPKLDMVAIPEFAMGAMENWGLVTYREVDLLIDEAKASSSQRQRVCTVVTHELAHQWFGNLVTMRWWDDLWLNEGFACWMQTFVADALFPEWRIWEQFGIDDQAAALKLDSLRTSHPIQVPIHHAEEVEEVFDAISYCKGACVIRMLHAVLGPQHFQQGLRNYMKKHAYGNTETTNLWEAWEEVSGKPIGKMMSSWTEQMGYPVVTVKSAEFGDNKLSLSLAQEWFIADGSAGNADEQKQWVVPLLVAAQGQERALHMLEAAEGRIEVPAASASAWVKLNAGQESLFRVVYPSSMVGALKAAVASKEMGCDDRAALLTDAVALCKAGKMRVEDLASLLQAFGDEDSYTAWCGVQMAIGALAKVLGDVGGEAKRALSRFVVRLASKAHARLGWGEGEGEGKALGHLDRMMQAVLIELMTEHVGHGNGVDGDDQEAAFVAEARRRFDQQLESGEGLPAEFRTAVFRVVLRLGGKAEYERLLALFPTLQQDIERKHVMSALGAAPDRALKLRTMEWAMADIKLQDFFYPMAGVSESGPVGREVAWGFLKDRLPDIKAKVAKASPSLMDAVVVYCARGFCSVEGANEIEEFFKKNPLPQSQRRIAQLVESVRVDAAFRDVVAASDLAKPEFWDAL